MNTPYENLANAIILQAVKDYRNDLKRLAKHPFNSAALAEKREIERFFHSVWFAVLTSIDPELLIRRLCEEVA